MKPTPHSQPVLSSPREQRLWLWTVAALAATFSTLGLTPAVAGELRENDFVAFGFLFCLAAMGTAVVVTALRARPGRVEVGVLLAMSAVYVLAFLRMSIPEERTHLFEYSMVALLIYEALSERASHGRRVPMLALVAFAATAAIGVLDEVVQSFIPNRVFDPIDILFNTLAAFMTVMTISVLKRARRRHSA